MSMRPGWMVLALIMAMAALTSATASATEDAFNACFASELAFFETSLKLPQGANIGARIATIDAAVRQQHPDFDLANPKPDWAQDCMRSQDAEACQPSRMVEYVNAWGPAVVGAGAARSAEDAWADQKQRICAGALAPVDHQRAIGPGEPGASPLGTIARHPIDDVLALLIIGVGSYLVWMLRQQSGDVR